MEVQAASPSPTSVLLLDEPPPSKRVKIEKILTPVAFKLLIVLRAAAYTIPPNIEYLKTKSIVNTLRLEIINRKIEKIQIKILKSPYPEKLAPIQNIFDKAKLLIAKYETSFKAYVDLAKQLHLLIKGENDLIEIPDFPGNPFLVCLNSPPSKPSFICVSIEQIQRARKIYSLFLENVKINGCAPFIEKVKSEVLCLIGILAHNKTIMDAFKTIFSHPIEKLSIRKSDEYCYHAKGPNQNVIYLKNIPFIRAFVKNKWQEVVDETGISFQIVEPAFKGILHEILHHIVHVKKIPISKDPSLEINKWTDEEERYVIGGKEANHPFSENYLNFVLGLPFRASHIFHSFSLKSPLLSREITVASHSYFNSKNFTSLLDFEYRTDILDEDKPRNFLYYSYQILIIKNAPEMLKDTFRSLGYKEDLTIEEQINEYKELIEDKVIESMHLMLDFFPIPEEIIPLILSSDWKDDPKIRAKMPASLETTADSAHK
jgi:hypothetical protein